MSRLDVESVLGGLRDARHETIMAWCQEIDSESAVHLLNALLGVELAIVALEKSNDPDAERRAAERIRDDAQRIQREAEALMQGDDEPSVGDEREAVSP